MDALIQVAAEMAPDLAAYEDAERPEVRGPHWQIETLADADFALRRQGECLAEAAEVDAMERAAIAQIRARADKIRKAAMVGAGFFEAKVLAWMERNRDGIVKGKKKSRSLLHGTVGWRSSTERLAVEDEAAVEEWLRMLPRDSPLARWKVEPAMQAINEEFKTAGIVPPGFKVVPSEDTPYVKPAPIPALTKGDK